jgi:hypothetical protein
VGHRYLYLSVRRLERSALIRLLLAALLLGALAAPEIPRARVNRAGELEVAIPSLPLLNKEVRRQLTSGLTTVLVIRIDEGVRGAARAEIRYDLWDEKYLVTTISFDGRRDQHAFADHEKLVHWWRATAFRVARPTRVTDQPVLVRLEVLPFSAREAAEAQRWFSDSVGAERKRESGDPQTSSGALLDAIIGTSVQRRPILEYRWRVKIEAEAR